MPSAWLSSTTRLSVIWVSAQRKPTTVGSDAVARKKGYTVILSYPIIGSHRDSMIYVFDGVVDDRAVSPLGSR